MPLGAAGDVGAEPMDDAGQLHGSALTAWALAHHVAAQAGVLDRELLDAGEQHPVEVILPAEVVLAVLEQPARQRQQDPPLGEQDEPADGRADASTSARWVCSRHSTSASSSSGSSVASRLRSSTARASTRAHRVEDLLVLIVGGTAALDQVPPQPRADVALDLAHHGVHADASDRPSAYFAENASSTLPGSPLHSA